MIISRAPLRVPLGGGGTDLPSYYEKHEGYLIAGTINKYIFVGANHQFYDNYNLKYSQIEIEEKINNVDHNLFREALKLLDIDKGIELTSLADIPAGTGLGSSGAFLVALLNTLYEYKGSKVDKRTLAQEACKIELEILKEHEGKQDKFVCSFGGIKAYKFHKNGRVSVIPIANDDIIRSELENNLFLFFTGEKRKGTASTSLKKQDEELKQEESDMIVKMHEIKSIGIATKTAFENCDFDKFGSLLDRHWEIKKKYSPGCTNKFIDECYQKAMDCGCLGGKIMGAGGGGGFFMFYHPGPPTSQWQFIDEMKKLGLTEMEFKFDFDGVKGIVEDGK